MVSTEWYGASALFYLFEFCWCRDLFSMACFDHLHICILKVGGFHQGILKLAMEPSFLGTALMEGGPDRKIILDQSPGVDEVLRDLFCYAVSLVLEDYIWMC